MDLSSLYHTLPAPPLPPSSSSRQPTSISDLPIELVEQVLDEGLSDPEITSQSLYWLSLVCSQWTEPALTRLYRSLNLDSVIRVSGLAKSDALRRYKTEKLRIEYNIEREGGHLEELLGVIGSREGVIELDWSRKCSAEPEVVEAVLSSPALAGLRHLIFLVRPAGNAYQAGFESLNVPFRLETLVTKLDWTGFVLGRIVDGSLVDEVSSITSLDVTATPNVNQLDYLGHIWEAAFSLKSLYLPSIDNPTEDTNHYGYFQDTMNFLGDCTSLETLSIECESYIEPQWVPTTLIRVFRTATSQLKLFAYGGARIHWTKRAFEVLEEAMQEGGVLAELERLQFWKVSLKELEEVEGWEILSDLLDEKGIRLVTKK